MNAHQITALSLLLAAGGAALAQGSPGTPVATVQHSPGGVDYLSGGAGEEERAAMSARQAELPLKLELSAGGGEYVVADRVSVLTPQGELLTVRDAGPLVMMKLEPGAYTLEATWKGRTERRTVRVGPGRQTVELRFPG